MGKEERNVSSTATVVALRSNFGEQAVVSKVKDIWNNPVVGEIPVGVAEEGGDHDAFNHKLDFQSLNTAELVIHYRPSDAHSFIHGDG